MADKIVGGGRKGRGAGVGEGQVTECLGMA